MRRRSRLAVPNDPAESSEHAHSPSVADALQVAYRLLDLNAVQRAWRCVESFRSWPMSDAQQMRVCRIEALAALDRNLPSIAVVALDEAMTIAAKLDAPEDMARLACLRAQAHHELQEFLLAAVCGEQALQAWISLASDHTTMDLAFEASLHDRLGTEYFLAGDFSLADYHVETGSQLARCLTASRVSALRAANLDWTRALIEFWRGNLAIAIASANNALDIVAPYGSQIAAGRLRILIVNILLSQISPAGAPIRSTHSDQLLTRADSLLKHAFTSLQGTADLAGLCLANLADIRLSRLLGQQIPWRLRGEGLVRDAVDLDDLLLMGKAYTTLGLEFMADSFANAARECFTRALTAFDLSLAPAEGVFARRELLREQEMRDS